MRGVASVGIMDCQQTQKHKDVCREQGFNPNSRKEFPMFYVFPRGPKKRDGRPAGEVLFKNSMKDGV